MQINRILRTLTKAIVLILLLSFLLTGGSKVALGLYGIGIFTTLGIVYLLLDRILGIKEALNFKNIKNLLTLNLLTSMLSIIIVVAVLFIELGQVL